MGMNMRNKIKGRLGRASAALLIIASQGCKENESARWLVNGLLDPTQVGSFTEPKRTEIRSVLSILEEPVGIQNAEEPGPPDLVADFSEMRIGPGDAITISIFELLAPNQSTEQQIRVNNSGYETLPVMGRVKVAGFTARELELELKEQLRAAEILEDAEVQVTLLQSVTTQYSVIGSVSRPGTYALSSPDFRLLNAVAEVGGLSPLIDKLYVFRKQSQFGTWPTTIPTTLPASILNGPTAEPVMFTLSDVARSQPSTRSTTSSVATSMQSTSARSTMPSEVIGSVPSTRSATPDFTLPASVPALTPTSAVVAPAVKVNELDILEGGPTTSPDNWEWDSATGEWISRAEREVVSEALPAAAEPTQIEGNAATTTPSNPLPERGLAAEEMEGLGPAVRIMEIPTKELLEGDPRYNIVIRPFDVINVPPGMIGEYYLMGNVARGGAYGIQGRRPTVKEAIASAGGFGPLAWPSRADLVRRISQDEEQLIQLDLDAIFSGNAPDFYLKPNDIVNVGTNPAAIFLAVLRNAFRFTYGFGFVYDRNFADADTFGAKEQLKTRRSAEALQRGLPN
jgi:polysaccharide export outer membrane protein